MVGSGLQFAAKFHPEAGDRVSVMYCGGGLGGCGGVSTGLSALIVGGFCYCEALKGPIRCDGPATGAGHRSLHYHI